MERRGGVIDLPGVSLHHPEAGGSTPPRKFLRAEPAMPSILSHPFLVMVSKKHKRLEKRQIKQEKEEARKAEQRKDTFWLALVIVAPLLIIATLVIIIGLDQESEEPPTPTVPPLSGSVQVETEDGSQPLIEVLPVEPTP